ncbi:MAG TPA: NAD(+)/NADH kinase [Candidatus Obscuribacterales bacterium]
MKLRKVLIIHKKSTFQIQAVEHREARFLKLLEEGHEAVTRVKVAHTEHMGTLEHLKAELDKRAIEHKAVARAELSGPVTGVDLVVSVGGDGTFLDASHHMSDDIPLLGINSSSSSSFGHFCLATERNLERILDDIQHDRIAPERILRLELQLNGSVLPELVLNEVLVAHSNPAATSRYFIERGDTVEEQRSSGIWVGTAAGSTGSLRSAGGTVLPIVDQRYQFVVREACMRPGEKWRLTKGILERSESIRVVSQMRTGTLFIDGQHIDYQFGLGDEVIIKPSRHDLLAFVAPDVNDIFI